MEQQALFQRFDMKVSVFAQNISTAPERAQPAAMLCPSDAAQGRFFQHDAFSSGKSFGKANYVGYASLHLLFMSLGRSHGWIRCSRSGRTTAP